PDGAARIVLIADHAGRAIPQALGTLGLGPAELARHIAWDIGIADATRLLGRRLDAAAAPPPACPGAWPPRPLSPGIPASSSIATASSAIPPPWPRRATAWPCPAIAA